MQAYKKYKDSGIDWLGKVPEHWECKRLGNWFTQRNEKVSDKDFAPLSVTKNGILPQLESAAKTNDGDNRKLVRKGDFVINSRSDRKGSSGLSLLDGSVSLINIVLKLRKLNNKYATFLLKSNSFIEEFYRNGHGIVADLWTTRFDDMKFIYLSIPPLNEQEAIASFLDEKCNKIDKAISIKESQMEKLREFRQITIHEAVTKGLDKQVKMKDSGIDWIGEIPEHWEVKAMKRITHLQSGNTITSEEFKEDGYPVFGGNGFRGYTNRYTNEGETILIGRQGALCGNVNIANGKFFASEHAIVVYPLNNEALEWLGEIIRDADLNRLSQSAAQPGIAVSVIKNIMFPYPPISEQVQIGKYIKQQTSKINQAIDLKEKQIAQLKKYKQSLINDVVTGKVCVPQLTSMQ